MKNVILDIHTCNGHNKMEKEINAYLKQINHFFIEGNDRDIVLKTIKEKIESIRRSSRVKRNLVVRSSDYGIYVYYEYGDNPIVQLLLTEIDGLISVNNGIMMLEYDDE